MANLIEDPWKVLPCSGSAEGCTVSFTDEGFLDGERDVLYYARAIEEPSQVINAGNLRCEFDADGNCIKVNPCHGDYRSGDEECTVSSAQRAWSSPIFVNYSGFSLTAAQP